MRVAIIGRTEILFETAELLVEQGHEIALVITNKEAPEYTRTAEDFRIFAQNHGAAFIQTPRILETIDAIKALPPIDVAVSKNYSGIIPHEVISCFRLGILNAHGGDLPRYRGNACQAWAILNGEDRIGLCIHSMIGGELDNGDIVARAYLPIDHITKVTEVWEWMRKKTPGLFAEALFKLGENPKYILERQSKDPRDALRCYPRKPEDGRIDWNKSAVEILRLINACNRPYAGAFCSFEGLKLIIWDAEPAPEENFLAIPGQITLIGDGYVEVATGAGKLRVKEIEVSGEQRVPSQIVRSIRQRFD